QNQNTGAPDAPDGGTSCTRRTPEGIGNGPLGVTTCTRQPDFEPSTGARRATQIVNHGGCGETRGAAVAASSPAEPVAKLPWHTPTYIEIPLPKTARRSLATGGRMIRALH